MKTCLEPLLSTSKEDAKDHHTQNVLFVKHYIQRTLLSKLSEKMYQKFVDREFTNDLTSKFSFVFFRNAEGILNVFVERVDAPVTCGPIGTSFYKPIDRTWHDILGWSHPLSLKISLDDTEYCLLIPSNPNSSQLILTYDIRPSQENIVEKNAFCPKIIWQTINQTHVALEAATRAFTLQNPSWQHHILSNEKAMQIITDLEDPRGIEAWDTLLPGAFRADLLRYILLYHYGGVYGDIKIWPRYPLDAILPFKDTDCINELENCKKKVLLVRDIRGAGVLNAFMAATPKTSFMRLVIDRLYEKIEKRYYGDHILGVSGPKHLEECLCEYTKNNEKNEEFVFWQFEHSGIGIRDVNELTVIQFHNGEYRRVMARPGHPAHYEAAYKERRVYFDRNPPVPNANDWSYLVWQSLIVGALVAFSLIAFFRLWRRKLAPKPK